MPVYNINRDSLGDTSDKGAERYRSDLEQRMNRYDSPRGTIWRRLYPWRVQWGGSNDSDTRNAWDEIAQQVWDDNIADYS